MLSRSRNRPFTAILAALLAIPLLVITAPPAAAADGYELTWTNVDSNDWAADFSNGITHAFPALERRVSGGADDIDDLVETISITQGDGFVVNSDDLGVGGDHCDALAVDGDDAVATCAIRVNFPDTAPAGIVEVTSTVTDGDGFTETETATIYRLTAEVSVDAAGALPVPVQVGDEPVFDVTVENTGAAGFDIRQIGLAGGNFDIGSSDCGPNLGTTLAPGEQGTFTCTIEPLTQTAEPHIRAELRWFEYPGPTSTSAFSGVVAGTHANERGAPVFELQLDPSVAISATAEPATILGGGTSTIQLDVTNDGDVGFDDIDLDVLVDGTVACSITDDDALLVGGSVDLGTCDVSPALGHEVTIEGTADYTVHDGTETYGFGPVAVDLSTHTDALSVTARYGVVNETLTPPTFVQRDVLPMSPDPNFHLGGPAVLEVTVTNLDGNTDLGAVDVSTDLPGCADRTVALDGGESETFECAGPSPDDGTTAVTTVTATAHTGGSTLQASADADLTFFGIELRAGIDPSWNGIDLDVPFLFTIANAGALPLDVQGAAWQVFSDQYGYWIDPPADTCSFRSTDPLAVGDTVIGSGCTLLAGDLVDGLSILGFGVEDEWGEGPSSYDDVELRFDPSGLVTGIAELNGEAFGDVEVELRLLDLLELPRAEDGADPAPNSGGDGGADGCEAVGELTGAAVGGVVAATTSDADGAFCFDDVPPGTYELVVTTDVDADLDQVVVDGADGFTTNSPATSEAFFVGFASAALGETIHASIAFSADAPVDDPDPVAAPEDADPVDAPATTAEELAATGSGMMSLTTAALAALLIGMAILVPGRRHTRPATVGSAPRRSEP